MMWGCSTSFASECASRTAAAHPSASPVNEELLHLPQRCGCLAGNAARRSFCVAYFRTQPHQSPLLPK